MTAAKAWLPAILWAWCACAAAADKEQRFDVWEYQVQGNTVQLKRQTIERALTPYLGLQRTVEDVEDARDALVAAYRDAGYPTVLVEIPEQDVQGGTVRLRAIAGSVARLRVTGSRYFSHGRIRALVPSLMPGSVPFLPKVQEQLNALNSASPDRTITPVLRPGAEPGTLEVELKVKDTLPLHGSIEVNDRNSPNTERLRVNAQLSYNNLWQREHSLSLAYQTAPEDTDQVQVLSGTYVLRVPRSDKRIAIYGVRSQSDVATLSDLTVLGNGDILGLRAIAPLRSRANFFHSLTLGADYKDFDESVNLAGADSINTPIQYTHFSAQYSATLRAAASLTRFDIGADFGLRGINEKRVDCFGQEVDQFECKRAEAQPNYLYVRANLEHSRNFLFGSTLIGRVAGQIANSPLISNEQFSAGGVESVRGYLESQRLGDDAVQAGLELRSPSLAKRLGAPMQNLQFLTFIEGAKLRVREALPGQTEDFLLAGAGVGLRLTAWRNLNAALDIAWPFKKADTVDAGESRVHFLVDYGF